MIRILLVDDQTVVREGLRSLLAPEPVVGGQADGVEAIAAGTLRPDILLMRMPRLDGRPPHASKRSRPEVASMVTLHDDTEYLMRAVADALPAMLKDASVRHRRGGARRTRAGAYFNADAASAQEVAACLSVRALASCPRARWR